MREVTKEEIMNYFYDLVCNLSEDEKVAYWNIYCERTQRNSRVIHYNTAGVLNAFFETPAQALEAVQYDSEYSYNDYYFTYDDIYGIVSFDFLGDENSPFVTDELVNMLMNSKSTYYQVKCILEKD